MAAIVLDGGQTQHLKMGDTSLETCESSLDTSTSQTEAASDDEDDELLALRIAALESIKLKESKLASSKVPATQQSKKPDFVIKSHPKRSNLLSIVTHEEEFETSHGDHPPHKHSPPPTVTPFFDPTRPPPGFARNSPPASQRRFSRSPPRRYSRSPRRWSRSPQSRRRSISPPGPFRRRRSFSRSPMRRSKSPLRRRSRSPPPPPRRSPMPRRSPSPSEWETDTESEDEKVDDVKTEVKEEEVQKPVKKHAAVKKPQNDEDPDASVDDVLKLDATDEVDEFSAFLNEFEDEVLAEKEAAKENPEKKIKKERPVTEKKVLEGKRLRKKIKPKKDTPPPRLRSRSPGRRRSASPRWRMGSKTGGVRSPLGGRMRSPGRRYFSPGRGRDGKLSPRRRNRTPSLSPETRKKRAQLKGSPLKRSSKSPESRSAKSRESRERSSKSKDKTVKESKPVETLAEKEERERKEYEERLQKLPSQDREILEARRKKFEKKVDINSTEPKKISLKSDKPETQTKRERVDRFESKSEDDELNADIGDTLDMFDEQKKSAKVVNENDPPARKNVTDLRVQLHKKRQALGPSPGSVRQEQSANPGVGGKHPLLRSVSPSSGPNSDGLDDDDFGPVSQSGRRKVVPPGKVPVKARLKISVENRSEEESDRSPSPPPKKMSKKRRRSGDSLDSTGDLSGIGGRRILVVRKDISRENSPEDISITKTTSPRKGIKKALHLRLGKKVDQAQFSENEIYAEMLRQQEEKRHSKKLKKEVKEMKKREKLEKKGKKKSKKVKKTSMSNDEDLSDEDLKDSLKRALSPEADSEEELFRFFEDQEQSSEEKKRKKRNSSGKGDQQARSRRSSGEKSSRKRRPSTTSSIPPIKIKIGGKVETINPRGEEIGQRGSGDFGKIKLRLGKKVDVESRSVGKGTRRDSGEMLFDLEKFQGSTDEESLDILEKMKRKNEKRLRRMREIEQDKLMFA